MAGKRRLRRQNRALRQRLRALTKGPEALTAPLGPRRLRKEMDAATRLRFAPEQREIDQQQSASDVQQARITDWFGKFKADTDAAIAAKNERDRLAQEAVAARQTAAQTQDDAARGATQQRAQADAAIRGTTPGAEPFKADLDAAAARRATTNTFGDLLAAQASAQGNFLDDRRRIASGSEVQAHLDESGRRRLIDQAEQDLKADKGAFRIDYRRGVREDERRNELERAAFGLEERKTEIDAALAAAAQRSLDSDRRADNKRQRRQERRQRMENDRKYQLDLDKFGAAQAKDNYQKANKLGPYKPASSGSDKDGDGKKDLSPSEIRTRRKERREAWTEASTAASDMENLSKSPYTDDKGTKEEEDDVTRSASREETFAALRRAPYNYSQDQILVAYALFKKTPTWDAKTIAAAKRLGIRIPKKYLPTGYSKGEGRPD